MTNFLLKTILIKSLFQQLQPLEIYCKFLNPLQWKNNCLIGKCNVLRDVINQQKMRIVRFICKYIFFIVSTSKPISN